MNCNFVSISVKKNILQSHNFISINFKNKIYCILLGGSVTSSDRNVEYNQVNRLNRELQLEHEIDTASEISNSSEVSKVALQQIREQMAVSLARMKDLEEQVKLIPNLKVRFCHIFFFR